MFFGPELFLTFSGVGVLMRNLSNKVASITLVWAGSAVDLFTDSVDNLLGWDCWCSLGVPVEEVVIVLPSWECLNHLWGMFA